MSSTRQLQLHTTASHVRSPRAEAAIQQAPAPQQQSTQQSPAAPPTVLQRIAGTPLGAAAVAAATPAASSQAQAPLPIYEHPGASAAAPAAAPATAAPAAAAPAAGHDGQAPANTRRSTPLEDVTLVQRLSQFIDKWNPTPPYTPAPAPDQLDAEVLQQLYEEAAAQGLLGDDAPGVDAGAEEPGVDAGAEEPGVDAEHTAAAAPAAAAATHVGQQAEAMDLDVDRVAASKAAVGASAANSTPAVAPLPTHLASVDEGTVLQDAVEGTSPQDAVEGTAASAGALGEQACPSDISAGVSGPSHAAAYHPHVLADLQHMVHIL